MILATQAPSRRPRGAANGGRTTDDVSHAPRATLHAGGAPCARKIAEMQNSRFEVVDQGHLMGRGTLVNALIETLSRREIRPHAQWRRAQQTLPPPGPARPQLHSLHRRRAPSLSLSNVPGETQRVYVHLASYFDQRRSTQFALRAVTWSRATRM